ncbi:MAG TPA: class I SAM-dependent methyltransferase [Planctomycetota bacterium]|nr:class I SAM-dependent methyltransferase [Planctomycetota bacterium]
MKSEGYELAQWEQSVETWTRNTDRIERLTADATAALLARLQPRPGQRLLDFAAGSGDPSLQLAQLVGPTGHVLATDGVREMLAVLERRAAELHLGNLSVLHAPAEELALPEASFDGACSRFGIMFFPHPPRALARIHRAVRPGGRVAVAAWGAREKNPFFTLVFDTLEELGVPDPAPPEARTVFEFSEPGKLAATLEAAGWHDVREEREPMRMPLPGANPDGLLDFLADMSRRTSERLAPLDAATRERARQILARRAARYARTGGMDFPGEVLVASGRA